MKLEFSRQFFEKYSNITFQKIHPVGAVFFHAGGRADGRLGMKKLIVAFRSFANAPETHFNFFISCSFVRKGPIFVFC